MRENYLKNRFFCNFLLFKALLIPYFIIYFILSNLQKKIFKMYYLRYSDK